MDSGELTVGAQFLQEGACLDYGAATLIRSRHESSHQRVNTFVFGAVTAIAMKVNRQMSTCPDGCRKRRLLSHLSFHRMSSRPLAVDLDCAVDSE